MKKYLLRLITKRNETQVSDKLCAKKGTAEKGEYLFIGLAVCFGLQ